jgi:hypothetical protein
MDMGVTPLVCGMLDAKTWELTSSQSMRPARASTGQAFAATFAVLWQPARASGLSLGAPILVEELAGMPNRAQPNCER